MGVQDILLLLHYDELIIYVYHGSVSVIIYGKLPRVNRQVELLNVTDSGRHVILNGDPQLIRYILKVAP